MCSDDFIITYIQQIIEENNIDINHKLSLGFFFTHKEKETLDIAKKMLSLNNYDVIEVVEEEKNYHLNIEIIEFYNLDKIVNHCKYLNEISKKLNIDIFHGFDIEEVNN